MSLYTILRRRAAQAQRDALGLVGPDPHAYWREEDKKHWAKIAGYAQQRQAETSADATVEPHELHRPEFHENAPQVGATTMEPGPPPSPPVASVVAPVAPQPAAPPPEPPSMSQILDDISVLIRQYLSCSDDQLAVLALWVVHTYGFEYFPVTPYLNIVSPESQSGKTVCLSLLNLLCHNPWMPNGLTPARLISRITHSQPTLLLDNWDTFFRPSDAQSIVGFLNAGSAHGNRFVTRPADREDDWDSDGSIRRNRYGYPIVTRPCNDESDKSIFCPKAFAGQGRLPVSLAGRCLPIVLQRRKPDESAFPFWPDIVFENAFRLVKPIPAWLNKNAGALRESVFGFLCGSWSGIPKHQDDATAPLLAIANVAGGKWPRKAYNALYRILSARPPEPTTIGVQLLSDIRSFFREHHDPPKIHTTPLLKHLNTLKDRPWTKRELTPNGLRLILQDFPIRRSRNMHINGQYLKGFTFQHFVESWKLYLPPLSSERTTSPGDTNGSSVVPNEVSAVPNAAPVVPLAAPVVPFTPSVVPENHDGNEIPSVFNNGAGAPT